MAIRADRVGVRQDQVDIHGRVTSPSFLNELLEDLPEWTDMPVWVNGTEELLPSNNSVPVTSPILADIAYPDIRRDNQYFTYRESPTPVDGLAKIKSIKGNTLVWNQLSKANTNSRATLGLTMQVVNGLLTISGTPTATTVQIRMTFDGFTIPQGHKVLIKGRSAKFYFRLQGNTSATTINDSVIFTTGSDVYNDLVLMSMNLDMSATYNESFYPQIFDLTAMGLDSLTVEEFASLFPLSYYSYNQGSLLSFNGTGLKTTGANLILFANGTRTGTGITGTVSDGVFSASGTATSAYANLNYFNELKVKNGEVYTVGLNKALNYGITFRFATDTTDSIFQQVTIPAGSQIVKFTANNDYNYVRLYISGISSGTAVSFSGMVPMIANADLNAFEPYTSSTLSLPISTYFPTGMKSAGTVYDELTPRKAITRIGAIDLGSLAWNRLAINEGYAFVSDEIADMKPIGNVTTANALCSPYTLYMSGNGYSMANDKTFRVGGTYFGTRRVAIRDDSYTDATAFKTAMSGVYLYYELATPVELPTMSFE